jgi:hypothetical protein
VSGELIIQMSLPKDFGISTPGMSVKQYVKNHICIEQCTGHPYFLNRSSATIFAHSSSLGGGESVFKIPNTRSSDIVRGGTAIFDGSKVSKILRASTIRISGIQVFTRLSTSNISLVSMGFIFYPPLLKTILYGLTKDERFAINLSPYYKTNLKLFQLELNLTNI